MKSILQKSILVFLVSFLIGAIACSLTSCGKTALPKEKVAELQKRHDEAIKEIKEKEKAALAAAEAQHKLDLANAEVEEVKKPKAEKPATPTTPTTAANTVPAPAPVK